MNYKKPRPEETINGGFVVMRRHRTSCRVSPAMLPFEHDTFKAAAEEMLKLSNKYPGQTFEVWERTASYVASVPQEQVSEPA